MKPLVYLLTIAALILGAQSGHCLSPEALDAMLKSGDPPTVVDVRPSFHYSKSHIPGAINIPASVCQEKNLPPLGQVVIYGDGIVIEWEDECLDSLNAREGITAERLDGGFSRWAALGYAATGPSGLSEESFQYVTYNMLSRAVETNPDVLLVDLRKESARKEGGEALADLQALFPKARVVKTGRKSSGLVDNSNARDLLVLIDNGDGKAQEYARHLRAAGMHRFIILAGGEPTLQSKGRPVKKTITREIPQ
ncbi:rhodanese-like domain-containing protein [Desulfatibacillum aliphaticivorans]|uniref:rhodanese-like domain-containing protein n=1 Tax=Desulfatibacillum aliphaticivorans TaxID=218208 RepID=UPI0004178618|nr:rhodanese-like domain-containing protein [Desulfatibacillum aliphaticivorans]